MRLEQIEVDVRAGDELGLRPEVVKVDVEGAEHDVLLGLRGTLEATKPTLLVDNSDWHNVTPLLRELGYEPYRWEVAENVFVQYYGTSVNTFYIHAERLDGMPLRGQLA